MEGINLSSTASLGPEGIWAGNTTEYAPPTDLVQLAEQLNWMRQDLRRIELAFSSVYELKQGFEKELAALSTKLALGLEASNQSLEKTGLDSQEVLAETREALEAQRTVIAERLEALIVKQQATTESLDAAQKNIYERLAELESALGALDSKIIGQASKTRVAFGDLSDQGVATLKAVELARTELGEQDRLLDQDIQQSRNQILGTLETQRLALDVRFAEIHAEQSAWVQELVTTTTDGDFAIQKDMALMFGRIEADLWPMLWASVKESIKKIFRRPKP